MRKLFYNLSPGKAAGPNNISPHVLKELAEEVAPILTLIFQSSVDTGSLPVDWKDVHVTPVFKKREQYDPANYRPVSLTSVCCKVLEHISTITIMDHLERNNIVCSQQHEFRKKRSFKTQFLEFADELIENGIIINMIVGILGKKKMKNLAHGQQTDILIVDFGKAFSKVNHSLLIHKLNQYGSQGEISRWISDFLNNRRQAGVCQPPVWCTTRGIRLGPCLFLIYINDLPETSTAQTRLFAGDTVAYKAVTQLRDLNQLAEWEKWWDMAFNPGKCTSLPVTRSRKPLGHQYELHGQMLETVSTAKYLGVTISRDMNWSEHINNVCTKSNKTLGFLKRNLKISSRKIKEMAYKSCVRPALEYACTVCDPYTQQHIDRIEATQRQAACFVMWRYRRTSSASAMIEDLSGPPSKAEERQLGWQCCTESTTTSLPPMEFRTSSSYHHHHPTHVNNKDTTSSSRSSTAEPSTSSTHSCWEPSETGMTCPGSHGGQGHRHICVKSLQTAVIQNNIVLFWVFFCTADPL